VIRLRLINFSRRYRRRWFVLERVLVWVLLVERDQCHTKEMTR